MIFVQNFLRRHPFGRKRSLSQLVHMSVESQMVFNRKAFDLRFVGEAARLRVRLQMTYGNLYSASQVAEVDGFDFDSEHRSVISEPV